MVKEKETHTCGHCDYTSDYKIAVIAHERKHKNEPVPEKSAETPKAAELPTGVDKDGVEWVGPGEETDDTPSTSPSQPGRFN